MTFLRAILVLCATALPAVAVAQSTSTRTTRPPAQDIPQAQRPPKGMCRIWVNNVPAARQPAPTDCASAVRNRPPNARVIFPDDRGSQKTARPSVPTTRKPPPPAPRDTSTAQRRKPPADHSPS
ncbi:MAG TPA: hypothetical protein VF981_16105 [Gemmatimonadaceae bacterium]